MVDDLDKAVERVLAAGGRLEEIRRNHLDPVVVAPTSPTSPIPPATDSTSFDDTHSGAPPNKALQLARHGAFRSILVAF